MIVSSVFLRDTSKAISTSFDDTIRLVEEGKPSSGRAELKAQSSSADAPFMFWFIETGAAAGFGGFVVDEKSNMDVEGALFCCGRLKGDPCRCTFDGAENAANGSEVDEGGAVCWSCCNNGGAGVVDCDTGREFENAANTS